MWPNEVSGFGQQKASAQGGSTIRGCFPAREPRCIIHTQLAPVKSFSTSRIALSHLGLLSS
jgi:hypothetical protein